MDHPAGMLLSAPVEPRLPARMLHIQAGLNMGTQGPSIHQADLSIFFRNAKAVWLVKCRCIHDNACLTHLATGQSDESTGRNE